MAGSIRDYRKDLPGEIVDGRYAFPIVKSVNAHGKETFWQVFVYLLNSACEVVPLKDSHFDGIPAGFMAQIAVESGQVGGKTRQVVPTIVRTGKDKGKTNETTPFTQALRDAFSKYNKQMQKTKDLELPCVMYLPMLAKQYEAKRVDFNENVWIQRKYNGLRALAIKCESPSRTEASRVEAKENNDVILYTRKRKIYGGLQHIKDSLKNIPRGVMIDGEIYGNMALQDISSIARGEEKDSLGLSYFVYDAYFPEEPKLIYSERLERLKKIVGGLKYVQIVETIPVHSTGEIDKFYKLFLEEKFEGAMIRLDGSYVEGVNDRRSNYLMKYKPTLDDEFEIVGWSLGEKGKASNSIMIKCQTKDGIEFTVTPALTIKEREELAKLMNTKTKEGTYFDTHYKGKMLIVLFDEYSNSGVPLRARTELKIRTWD